MAERPRNILVNQTINQTIVSPSAVLYSEVIISSNQLLNIHITPVDVLAAPGVGYYNKVLNIEYVLLYGGISYVLSGSPQIATCYDGNIAYPIHGILTLTFLSQAVNTVNFTLISLIGNVPTSNLENKTLKLVRTNGAGSYTTGNGTLKIKITYQKIQI